MKVLVRDMFDAVTLAQLTDAKVNIDAAPGKCIPYSHPLVFSSAASPANTIAANSSASAMVNIDKDSVFVVTNWKAAFWLETTTNLQLKYTPLPAVSDGYQSGDGTTVSVAIPGKQISIWGLRVQLENAGNPWTNGPVRLGNFFDMIEPSGLITNRVLAGGTQVKATIYNDHGAGTVSGEIVLNGVRLFDVGGY